MTGGEMSDTQEPKPQKINRMDPAWAMFAAAFISGPWHPAMECSPHDQYIRRSRFSGADSAWDALHSTLRSAPNEESVL